jgi:hypothetical protein
MSCLGLRWLEGKSEVEGGHYKNNLNASGNSYRVKYGQGRWIVKEERLSWLS